MLKQAILFTRHRNKQQKQYNKLLSMVQPKANSFNSYLDTYLLSIRKTSEFENTISLALKDLINNSLKPITISMLQEYHQQQISSIIIKVKQYRNHLKNLKTNILTKNKQIKRLLTRKHNMQKYQKQLELIQNRIKPIYNTLHSDHQIRIISDHIKGSHSLLKNYDFYNSLSTFLNNRIGQFEQNLRKIFIRNIRKFNHQQIMELYKFLSTLALFKKQTLPDLLIFCSKQALDIETQQLIKQYNPNNLKNQKVVLSKIEPDFVAPCFCGYLLLSETVLINLKSITQIFDSTIDLVDIKKKINQKLIVIFEGLKNVLCKPVINQIFILSVVEYFCSEIIKDLDVWWIITRSIAQTIKNKLFEYKNQIVQDLSLEMWKAVQVQYTTKLPLYQKILIIELSYHQKISWMTNKLTMSKQNSAPIPDCHILYSFFNFSKSFEKFCLNVPYFSPMDANFLVSNALQLLYFFFMQIFRTLIDYPLLISTKYQKHRHWSNYKASFSLLNQQQPKKQTRLIPDEQKVEILCKSIQFLSQLVKGHQWVLLYRHQQIRQSSIQRLNDLENVLTQLPLLTIDCFLQSRLKTIDLSILNNNQWILVPQPNYCTYLLTQELLAHSFSLDFLHNKDTKLQYNKRFEYVFIDKICSQNTKTTDFQKMIEQFSVIKRLLQNKGYKSTKEVQKFLVVCLSQQQEQILKLLYEKKFIYSLKSIQFLYSLIKGKSEEKIGFWQILTSVCEGQPTLI